MTALDHPEKENSLSSYLIFFAMAAATVASPGPGVVLTLNNAISQGGKQALPGIFGLSIGAMIVAAISATGVGILINSSDLAFNVMKIIGACYLIYLGIKLWRTNGIDIGSVPKVYKGRKRAEFIQGLNLQFTNPKSVFFFISIFPQFIDAKAEFFHQFILLVITYSGLLLVIHSGYA